MILSANTYITRLLITIKQSNNDLFLNLLNFLPFLEDILGRASYELLKVEILTVVLEVFPGSKKSGILTFYITPHQSLDFNFDLLYRLTMTSRIVQSTTETFNLNGL